MRIKYTKTEHTNDVKKVTEHELDIPIAEITELVLLFVQAYLGQ